jgi:hypothetical protein
MDNDPVEHVEVTDEKRVTVVHTRPSMVPYRVQWGLGFVVVIASAMLNAIIVADPMSLGISDVWKNWLTIGNVGLTAAMGFLPRLTAPPNAMRSGMD